jgi:hypothetical protein
MCARISPKAIDVDGTLWEYKRYGAQPRHFAIPCEIGLMRIVADQAAVIGAPLLREVRAASGPT